MNETFEKLLEQSTHPAGQSFRLQGETAGSGARWREAGGEISSLAAAPGGKPRDRLGGRGYRPADRQAAAGQLPREQSKMRQEVRTAFLWWNISEFDINPSWCGGMNYHKHSSV